MRLEHWVYTIPLRLRSLFHRNRLSAELDEELRNHIDRQIADNLPAAWALKKLAWPRCGHLVICCRCASRRTIHGAGAAWNCC